MMYSEVRQMTARNYTQTNTRLNNSILIDMDVVRCRFFSLHFILVTERKRWKKQATTAVCNTIRVSDAFCRINRANCNGHWSETFIDGVDTSCWHRVTNEYKYTQQASSTKWKSNQLNPLLDLLVLRSRHRYVESTVNLPIVCIYTCLSTRTFIRFPSPRKGKNIL